ncbi:MAG: hypothetical protein OQK12_16795 [Motiliproteus sp.]|nr:hypothetical protein [Motiliproteus sp.]MCW9051248.1 hypothetical protein [Motiliproteus sp.]
MDPFTILTTAKAVLSATGLDDKAKDWIGDKIGVKAAEKITDIAKAVTGHSDTSVMSPEQRDMVRAELERSASELRRLSREDLADARAMYADTDHETADQIAKNVVRYNLWAVFGLVVIFGLVNAFVPDKLLVSSISALIGGAISSLFQERQAVIGFFFGSSFGSKSKTKLLNTRQE